MTFTISDREDPVSKFDLFNKAQSTFVATDAPGSAPHLPSALRITDVDAEPEATGQGGNWPLIPWSRGPLSSAVIDALSRTPGTLGTMPDIDVTDALTDDDLHLALYL